MNLAHTGVMTKNIWTTITDEIRTRRAERARVRQLESELASYTTPSDIEDLLAAADRSEGPETELVRSILTDNLMAYHARRGVAA